MNTDIASAVTNQVSIMAIYMAVGYILTKAKALSHKGTQQMTTLLLYVVTPCVIVNSFLDYNTNSIADLGIAFFISIVYHIVAILAVGLLFKKSPDNDTYIINRFSSVYSNCGFMGIPLLQAALGSNGVFIGSAYLAVFNILIWTQGYNSFCQNNDKTFYKRVILNPGVIGVLVAMLIMITKINLPQIATTTISGMAALNTPVAMVLLGVYLAESKILNTLKNFSVYIITIIKLLILPTILIFAFKILDINTSISFAIIISASCPCATISAIFSAQFEKNSGYASSLVAISTLLSLVSLPLISHFATIILS